MSVIKKLAGETALYGMSHIFSRVLNFVIMAPYLAGQFPSDSSEYGIYSDIYSYSTILLTILVFRLDTALFRFGSKGDIDKTLGAALVPMLVGIAVVVGLSIPYADTLAEFLGYAESPHYIRWFVYILCFDALASMIYAKLRLESRPMRFLWFRIGNVVLNVVLVLIFFESIADSALGQQIEDYLGMTRKVDYVFLANLITSIVTIAVMSIEYMKVRLSFDKPLIKKMVWYAAPLVLVGIAGSVNQTFSTPIQKYFLGSDTLSNLADAGVYAAAAKLAILLNLFTTAFNYAAEPFFFNNADKENSKETYGVVALMYTIVACLATVGIVAYLDVLIMMFPEIYHKGAPVVPYLLFAYIFLGLYYNVSIWYKLKDKTHLGALISIVGMVITLVMSILLLPSVGTIASAYAALACYVTMVVICYFLGRRYYPIDYPVGRILGYIAGTALLCFAIISLKSEVTPMLYYIGVTLVLGSAVVVIWLGDVRKALRV